jgi:hypothetical protein
VDLPAPPCLANRPDDDFIPATITIITMIIIAAVAIIIIIIIIAIVIIIGRYRRATSNRMNRRDIQT